MKMFGEANGDSCLVNSSAAQPFYHALMQLKMSGFYWGKLSKTEAEQTLQDGRHGDFLVRDSRQDSYLYTISMKCKSKVVHIRTLYSKGTYSLEAELFGGEPSFDNFLKLIEHYVKFSKSGSNLTVYSVKNRKCRVQLLRPVKTTCPSLQHLCRTKVNCLMDDGQFSGKRFMLPKEIRSFLSAYPFSI